MQTWAKRGVHAALVTGGMLAVGSGVAAASGTYPEGSAPPPGESVLPPADDGAADQSAPGFAGELFPAETTTPHLLGGVGRHALPHGNPTTVLTGSIDPVRDLLPLVENETTREMPAVVDDSAWFRTVSPTERTRPMPVLELAGWVAEPSTAVEHPAATPSRGKHAQPGPNTPSEGFHRSLSWAGGLDEGFPEEPRAAVPADFAEPSAAEITAPLPRVPAAAGDEAPEEEVTEDEVTAEVTEEEVTGEEIAEEVTEDEVAGGEAAQPHGLIEVGGTPILVGPDEDVDLTTSDLAAPRYAMHRVPPELVAESVSAVPPALAPRQELMPLRVPGEALAKASEIPQLTDLVLRGEAREPRSTSGLPEVHEELPLVGELNAGGGGSVAAPTFNRIVDVLTGETRRARMDEPETLPFIPKVPAFTDRPLESLIEVLFLEELDLVSELRQVIQNPFRSEWAPRAAEPAPMALPVLDGLPDLTAVQGETLSGPLDEVLPDLADTVVLERI